MAGRQVVFSLLGLYLLACTTLAQHANDTEEHKEEYVEYAPYDGFYNNPAHPDWGAAETQLFRRVLPAYSDGTYEPSGTERPNPFDISDAVMNGSTGMPSFMNRTALLVFFGQQVVEEILDAQAAGCPPEYFNIKIPKGHASFDPEGEGGKEMPLLRSRYDMRTGLNPNNPRQQLNEISAYMDGTLTYGPNKAWTDALRLFKDGLLAATNDTKSEEDVGYYPALNDIRLPFANPAPPRVHVLRPVRRFYKIGNPRGNENPFLLTFGILWFRFHNFKARQIKEKYPDYSDEKIFNEARKWTIATHQRIVMYDWLPAWTTGNLPNYTGYDPTIHPGIAHVFQSAAMRFGHTLVPPGVFRRGHYPGSDGRCDFKMTTKLTGFEGKHGLRTCNVYWTGDEVMQEKFNNVDELLMGMASQITEREDNIITPDLRGFVFGPLEFSRRDLMAINIQRARDHGLPDYNTVRESYGLDRITRFEDINPNLSDQGPIERLKEVYNGNIDDLDLWPAGLLETTASGPGPTFTAIILDQFRRVRDGDRFWFENKNNGLFTDEELVELWSYNIRDVILNVTGIRPEDIQMNPFFFKDGDPCPQPFQLSAHNSSALSECTRKLTFDYFTGSEVSYVLSFLAIGVFLIAMIFVLIALAKWNQHKVQKQRAATRSKTVKGARPSQTADTTLASEWLGGKEGEREVLIKLDKPKRHILVQTNRGKPVRTIDLNLMMRAGSSAENVSTVASIDKGMRLVRFRVPKEYDLVLRFYDNKSRDDFIFKLHTFLRDHNISVADSTPMSEKQIYASAKTKGSRARLLERFFRVTFAYAFKYESPNALRKLKVDGKEMHDIISCELTKHEFAEALSLKPTSAFVENMFSLVDRDQDGYLSFREFLDVIVIFSKGSAEDKSRLLFDMYDLDQSGSLSRAEFRTMLKSLMELANETIEEQKLNELLDTMTSSHGLGNKPEITFKDFNSLLKEYENEFNYASLNFEGITDSTIDTKPKKRENVPTRARHTFHKAYRSQMDEEQSHRQSKTRIQIAEKPKSVSTQNAEITSFVNYMENHRLQIFWVTLYTLVVIGVFAERAYYYSIEREHAGLRRIAGYGVTVTRGAASAMMFTYSCLLVTMCRNTITFLRETFLRHYIPFDSAIAMHKYIAFLALLSTVIHIIGHSLNFYHIATQTANDLTCLFRNFFHATDELPKFHYWCWNTLTGFTGVLLTLVCITMYIFATEYARRNAFRAFWLTHNMYPIFFILMILHGAGRLVQPPFFHFFFLGPVTLFAVDKLISISRKKIEIAVVKAELLPSDVTYIEFKRPQNFEYKSGQWVRIASLVQSTSEYHPFTLTSAPHEENLSLHIRAVGPWTMNLRKTYDPNTLRENALPKIYLDGPYGEGHQDWHKYDVSVLVGGGIGVTPFAAILKDLVNRSKAGGRIVCQKVYFLWVTRTQKQFEWMTDIIRQVEENDSRNLVSVHLFITQFREKFDIRTTMLYICERHFQKISNRSLFTGLRSITHFGRPDFKGFFESLLMEHSNTNVFGVFSCGPPPMTAQVEQSCTEVNKTSQSGLFVHHFENF